MSSSFTVTIPLKNKQIRISKPSRAMVLEGLALAVVVALAAALRFANLSSLGYANHYYTAAVESMLQSWHNFFFVAAEPGGSVSIDKPPLGLWFQVASAAILGVNGLGVLLPQILAGIFSVIVLYYLVRRSFGPVAGLLAGLVLAITPVVIATDRNNTMDSTLILTLLLAAWAFIKSAETGKTRYLLGGAMLVGLGFNIKMLQAYLPLPAFYALYFFGSAERIWRKVGKTLGATVLLLVISLSWATIVDLTPADQRPYVGSSGNNTVLNLIVGYNGVNRLMGMNANRGFQADGLQPGMPQQPPTGQNNGFPPMNQNGNGAPQMGAGGRGGFGGGGGMSGTGQPGALRLFTAPLNKEMSWLLPFGLFGGLLLLLSTRLKWPVSPNHQALLLWGGWLVTGGVFFSVAGFFHEYYLTMLAAPVAALVGIGVMELWHIGEHRFWLAVVLLLGAGVGTMAYEVSIANAYIKTIFWLPVALSIMVAGVILLILDLIYTYWYKKHQDASQILRIDHADSTTGKSQLTLHNYQRYLAMAGFICVMAAILVTPGIWSGLTTLKSSSNQSLPAAYDGRSTGPNNRGATEVNLSLLDYLQANTTDNTYLMAVPSSMQGADYVLATGRPVLYMGGFMGQDQVVTINQLKEKVANGELRYIYSGGGRGRGIGAQQDVSSWLASTCKVVSGFETATRNTGAPDGTTSGGKASGFSSGFGGEMQVSLYDCGLHTQ